ncbi:hypothetical protein AMAG_01827 [Allomyces macrogynus ATCC 38327]|uniref:Uncharacterized protein n=1 Tax=Allomyces macrogynus (strain ATCC 38327) TaxID=578462 RepID=A0A0L0S0U2_ALLM3|nr:hypothetical protein AMAG_01827 [Allomyces macrogynus ATCC 38327]|eukprot:KNE55981.1 hypothetical protein AMAG_01827 [Allomyces macrogynus ATCC 38327]
MPPTAMTLAMHPADHHHHHPFSHDSKMQATIKPAPLSSTRAERPRGRSRTRRTVVATASAPARDPWQILLAAAQGDDSDDESDDSIRLPAAFLALLSAKAAARRPRIDLTNAVTVAVASSSASSSCDGCARCAAPLPVRPMHDVSTTRVFDGKIEADDQKCERV